MKRILIGISVACLAFAGLANGTAGANHAGDSSFPPEDKNVHVKVDVCHWANGHPHIVPVSVNAVTTLQDAKHGNLSLEADGSLESFVPHDTPGHEQDFVARIYLKHGNSENNLYVSENGCGVPPGENTVSAFVCFEGEVATFTDTNQTDLNLQVSAYLEENEGAIQVDSVDAVCEVVVTTTTTTTTTINTPEEPVTPEEPAAPVIQVAPVVPVVEAPRTAAPAPQPVKLPRTS